LLIPAIYSIFIFPEAGKNYTGFWNGFILGAVHGGAFIQNWTYHFFSPSHFYKADASSFWYGFSWWISATSQAISLGISAFGVFRKDS
jgi:hypothetical protein